MKITLPEPPSANRYWRKWRNRMVLSEEARAYKYSTYTLARRRGFKELEGPVRVTVRWFRAKKTGDLDNRLKVVIDALAGVCFADDKQVVELHAFRDDDKKNPRVEVTIEEAA